MHKRGTCVSACVCVCLPGADNSCGRSGLWVGELKRVFANGPASLSATSNKTLAGISSLQKATALGAAKADYVAAVSALEEWTAVAGVAAKLKGL